MNSDSHKTILLVEDMAIIAMAEANILKKNGFEVIIAYNGKEAVAVAIKNRELDLILMDIDLGRGMDGTEAAQKILQNREVPIVFLSNHTEKEIVEKTEKITSYGYVVKNSGETVLLASIKMAFKLFDAHTKRLESEKRLNLSLEGADIGLWDQNFTTQQVYRSDKWFSMLGYEPDHISGTLDFWKSIIHPDDYAYTMEAASKHEEGSSEIFKVEHRLKCKDGSYKWILNWGKISDRNKEGKPLRALGIHLNIDDRVKTEEALKQSEERLRFALEGNSDGIWDWNLKTGEVYFSPRYYLMLGYQPNEFLPSYTAWKDLLHPDDIESSEKKVLQSIEQLAPFSTEFRLKKKDGSYCWILARGKVAEKDSEGKALRITGSHTDINERKIAEESLRKNENKLQSIFKAAPIGIGVTSNRVLIEANERLCTMLGYTSEELIGKNARMLYPTQEEYEYVGNVKYGQIAKHGTGTVETRWIKKDGSIINILLSSTPINLQDLSGGITFTAFDISERKKVEEALKISLTKYQVLFDSFPLGITISDESGNIIESNKQAERLLGLSADEHSTRQIDGKEWRIIKTDGSPMQTEDYASVIALKENRLVENVQMGIVKDNNETTWINVTAAPIPLESYGVAIAYGDISELKRREEELQKSEQMFRHLFNNSPDAIFIIREDGKFVDANEVALKRYGYNLDELLTRTPNHLAPARLIEKIPEKFQNALIQPMHFEWVHIKKNGEEFPVEVHSKPIFINGRQHIFAEARDITDRKFAESALLESQQMLSSILNNIPIRVFWKDINSKYLGCNLPFALDAGFNSPEELYGKTDFDMGWKNEAELYRKDDKEVISSGIPRYDYEEPQTRANNEVGWLKTSKIPLKNINGEVIGILGTYEDITERKRTEEQLIKSEERYALAQSAAKIGSWDWNLVTDELTWSELVIPMFGFEKGEIKGTMNDFWSRLHPDDIPVIEEKVKATIEKNEDYDVDHRVIHPDGTVRWMHETGNVIRNEDGKPVRMLGVVQDITDRKKAEEQLKESEEKYRRFFEEDLSGVFVSTPEGKIKTCNQAYVNMMEYESVEEILSSRAEEHYSNPQERIDFLNLLREKRKLTDFEGGVITKKGKKLNTLENIIGIFDKDDNLVEFWGYVNDITEKKNAEVALKNAADEKEALHRELLHRVKNSFNLIKSLIYLERDKIKDESANRVLENLEMRIAALAQMYSILNASGVSEKINLGAYLKQVTESLALTYIDDYDKIKVHQSYDNIFTSPKNASSIGLIVNELLTNSLKYAFPNGKSGTITISLKSADGNANIIVSDDGVGVPEDFNIENAGGLGTQLVYMLTRQINGTITINKDKGVSYTISFPVDE